MTKEQYIKGIVSNVHCSNKRKKEIKKQLEADIDLRLENGESFEEISEQMGNVLEIAEGFNTSMPESEQTNYRRTKVSRLIIVIIVLLFLLSCVNYWFTAKTYPLENSKIYNQAEVERRIKETVDILDAQDYETLQEKSSVILMPMLTKERIDEARLKVSDQPFGERKSIGEIVCTELVQGSDHYAVGEIKVNYENVSVVYRITIDPEMKLAGLYMR